MSYNLYILLVVYPLLFVLNKILNSIKGIKKQAPLLLHVVSVIVLGYTFKDSFFRKEEWYLGLFVFLNYAFALSNSRYGFYRLLQLYTFSWLALVLLWGYVDLQHAILFVGILPLFDIKGDSVNALVKTIMWLIFSSLYIVSLGITVEIGYGIKDYFLEVMYVLIFIFLSNNRSHFKLMMYLMTLGMFNVLMEQYTYLPLYFKYFLVINQALEIFKGHKEERNIANIVMPLSILILPSFEPFSMMQIILALLVVFVDVDHIFVNKIRSEFKVLFYSTIIANIVYFTNAHDEIVRISSFLVIFALINSLAQLLPQKMSKTVIS